MSLLEGPNPSQLSMIQEQLREDSDRLQHSIQLLQKWISCQPHLPQDYENNMLYVFLRGCKHDLERTKKKIEMYFIVRTKVPQIFGDRNPTKEVMENYAKMMKLAPLPKLTPDGYRVTIFKIANSDATEWDTREVMRCIYMTADLRVAEETAIAGDIFIYDLEHLRTGHVIKYVTPLLKKALNAAHEAYPQRLKQIHYVNVPAVADRIIALTKSLIKEKIRNRLIVHNTVDDLLNYLPNDILPVEYGGTAGKFNDFIDQWSRHIIKHNKWFQQQDNVKATGNIPAHVSYSQYDDVLGVDGSFRKLEID